MRTLEIDDAVYDRLMDYLSSPHKPVTPDVVSTFIDASIDRALDEREAAD